MSVQRVRDGRIIEPRPIGPVKAVVGAGKTATTIETVPEGEIWEITAIHLVLVTSATTGTRSIQIFIRDEGDNHVYRFPEFSTTDISATKRITINKAASQDSDSHIQIAEPIKVWSKWDIRFEASLVTGDAFSYWIYRRRL